MVRRVRTVDLPNSHSRGTMQTPESRKSSEDEEEKVVTKKPYSAPTLVELDSFVTKGFGGDGGDGQSHSSTSLPPG